MHTAHVNTLYPLDYRHPTVGRVVLSWSGDDDVVSCCADDLRESVLLHCMHRTE